MCFCTSTFPVKFCAIVSNLIFTINNKLSGGGAKIALPSDVLNVGHLFLLSVKFYNVAHVLAIALKIAFGYCPNFQKHTKMAQATGYTVETWILL